ncbi:MAG: lipopolysaccharide biosynthesis protein [Vicinamibacterales bacterium]
MTRTHRFLNGFASGYVHLIVAAVVGLWLTPFFLRRLGADTYGLWLLGTQIIAYLLLMDFGVVALLPREAAYVTGRTGSQDAPELQRLIEKALTLAVAQTPFVVIAATAAWYWFPSAWSGLRTPLFVVLAVFIVTFPLRVFQAALTGLQDLAFVARAQFAAWAIGTVVNVWLVLHGYALSALAAGWCATQLLVVLSCGVRLARGLPGAMPRRLRIGDRTSVRDYLARSAWISVSQVSQVLLNGTDVMIVAALLGPAAVVPYACTGKLVAVLANQPQAILQSAAPALSELRTAGDRARLFTVSAALAQATLAVSGLVACVVVAINAGFVTWWVGPEQFGGMGLTLLLLGAMMIRHFNTTNVYALFCFGHERRLALTGLADGFATLVLSAALVGLFGLAGAPLGAIAGVVLVGGPLNIAALSRETGVEPHRLVTVLGPWFWRFFVMIAIAGLTGAWLRPSTFPVLALLGASAGLLYSLVVVTPLLRSPAGPYLRRLKGIVTFKGDSPLSATR